MIKDKNVGSFTVQDTFHIKFIKLELQKDDRYIRESFEMTFDTPRNTILIEVGDHSNRIIIIVLEHNRMPSNLVIQNIRKLSTELTEREQSEKSEKSEREQSENERPEENREKEEIVDEQQFTEKFFSNFFNGNIQLKNENNQKTNNSTFSWNIRKR